jgi:ribosome-associated toxin RatA of RatAB toxin-antitoxin module
VAATKVLEKNFNELKADVNRLYTLENAQLQAQDNLAVAQGNIALNLINVYRYLGGGWEIRTQKDNCGGVPMSLPPLPAAAGPELIPAPKPDAEPK